MPPITIKVVTDASPHHHIGYKITGSNSCAYLESGSVVLENVGSVNHSTAHSFTRNITVSIGTSIRCYTRTFGGSAQKKIDLYVNGKLVDTDNQNTQCCHCYHVLTEDDIPRYSHGQPTYLEQLYKLSSKNRTGVQYDPLQK